MRRRSIVVDPAAAAAASASVFAPAAIVEKEVNALERFILGFCDVVDCLFSEVVLVHLFIWY